ncbi:hypothetical protein ACS3SW_06420 [Roseobacteraceae bacterium S113]
MPKLIKLYIVQCAIGFGLSAIFTTILLYLNIGNLWGLASRDPLGWLAVAMIWIFNGTVFGAVQFAIAIMNLREDGPQEPRGGTRILAYAKAAQKQRI